MKKEKVGMSVFSWILSISIIIILSSFIILPPVFRIIFREKEEVIDYSTTESKENFSCTKSIDGLTVAIQYKYDFYPENKLVAITENYNYQILDGTDEYNCRQNNNTYSGIKGFQYVCETNGNTMIVSQRIKLNKYEQKSYKDLSLSEDYEAMKKSLISIGYTCNQQNDNVAK